PDAGSGARRDCATVTTRTALRHPVQYGSILPVEKLMILPSVAGDRASMHLISFATSGSMADAPCIALGSSLVAMNTGWNSPTSTPCGFRATVSRVMYLLSAA